MISLKVVVSIVPHKRLRKMDVDFTQKCLWCHVRGWFPEFVFSFVLFVRYIFLYNWVSKSLFQVHNLVLNKIHIKGLVTITSLIYLKRLIGTDY